MPSTPTYRKKLIEVDLPLAEINSESKEKNSPAQKGNPTTLHRWWARRPLVVCRAIAFASVVDDPSSLPHVFETTEEQEAERRRLHAIIVSLANRNHGTSGDTLEDAQIEIARSLARNEGIPAPKSAENARIYISKLGPTIYDPFCGGGSIPLEAQRIGLKTYSADLNPVAVLISRALLEFPSSFDGKPPDQPGFTTDKGRLAGCDWSRRRHPFLRTSPTRIGAAKPQRPISTDEFCTVKSKHYRSLDLV